MGQDTRENAKDYIAHSRNILMSQININQKMEETERLKEYIIMEQEKLEEAKRNLEEQKEKFEKTIRDSNAMVEDLGM